MQDEAPRCYRHPDRETYVSCSECGRPICEECMSYAPVGLRCPEHATVGGHARSPHRTARQMQRRISSHDARATIGLIALNVAVYLVTVAQGAGINEPGGTLMSKLWLTGADVGNGE